MLRRIVLAPIACLSLLACESLPVQSPTPTTSHSMVPAATATFAASPPATAMATTAPAFSCGGSGSETLVAYGDGGDLWLYNVDRDEGRQLTTDREERYDRNPGFVAGSCLAFSTNGPASIELIDLSPEGSRRTIVEETGGIVDLAISPDQAAVVYLQIDFDVDSTYRLKRVGVEGGTPEVLYTFDANLGRGGGSEDEASVAWSPDGAVILVANTHEYSVEYPYGAVYLFEKTGERLGRWAGTHPRWSPDGGTVFYRRSAWLDGQRWRAMDVASMESTSVGFRSGTNGLAVSPSGRHVAYDTSVFGDRPGTASTREAPVVYLYDLQTGNETLLKRGALGPVWISATDLVVTNARYPERPSFNSWESLGTVSRISVGGDRERIDMSSTLFDIDVFLGS